MNRVFKYLINNTKGMNFIQVLLTSSAIAGLALVGLKLSESQSKLARSTYENYLVGYLFQEIKGLLQNPSVCKATLGGLSPNGATFNVIRRPLKTSKSNEIYVLHFPLSKKGESHSYFDSKIDISSYELIKGQEDNIAIVRVNFGLAESKMKLKKEVKLTYELDSEEKIRKCRLATYRSPVSSDGFWERRNNALNLENLKLQIRSSKNTSAQVYMNGPLKLIEADVRPCTSSLEGVLENQKGALVYCHNERWRPFGHKEPNWSRVFSYKTIRNIKGQTEEKTRRHRLCFLTGQEKKSATDGCDLKRVNNEYQSQYRIVAFTSDSATKNICEVSCVD